MTDLQITQQTLEDQQVLLTIEVPQPRVEQALRAAAQRLGKQYRFPGFRPGKAPYNVIVQRIGREALLEEAAEALRNEVYSEAVESAGITPYAPGNLRDLSFDPLTYHIGVPLPPKVELGDYRSIRIAGEVVDEEAVEGRVQEQLESMAGQQTTWEAVDRPIEYDDMVTLRLKLTVDGEVVLEDDDWDFSPDTKEYTMAPEFDAAFIGMKVGESKTFSAAFPDDSDSVWKGQEGLFDVEVKGVKGKALPVLDDEFARKVSEFQTLDELKQSIRDHLMEHAREDAESAYTAKVLDAAIEQAQLVYAPAAIDRAVNVLANEQESLYHAYGFKDMAEVLRLQGRTVEQFLEDLRPDAEKRLRLELVLDAVATSEELPVSDYEVDQYLGEGFAADPAGLERMQNLLATDPSLRDYMAGKVSQRKARRLLIAIAKGEDVPAPGQHVAEQAPPVAELAPVEVEPVEAEAEASAEALAELESQSESAVETETVESKAASQLEPAAEATLTPNIDAA